jgi:hypothetical protein
VGSLIARLRARLTYANVVATLALFVALGGTSFAVTQITSRDIKNRSIQRVDVKKNALTGGEINESKLRAVPRAKRADSALNALTATTAGSAASADVAKNADNAANAASLGGQTATSFEKSTRTQFGRAPVDPPDLASQQTVLSWPALGGELRTATNQSGCAPDLGFSVRNTKTNGSLSLFENVSGFHASVPAASTISTCTNDPGPGSGTRQLHGQLTDSSGKALFFDCLVDNGELRCLGTRSEP